MKYKISQYAKKFNVTTRTVWNWIYAGKLHIERTDTNRVLIVDDEDCDIKQHVAIYARVSSSENKSNLETQKQRLLDYCAAKGYQVKRIVTETGSGLNDKRPRLESLLTDYSIKIIVAEHTDRIASFGLNYINKLLEMQGRRFEIINSSNDDKKELTEDFVSIITSFCARIYGHRRSKRKTEKIIEELRNEE